MMLSAWPATVQWALAIMAGLLVMASLVSWWLKTSRPDRNYLELRQRVRIWWLIVAVFLAGVLLNRDEDA